MRRILNKIAIKVGLCTCVALSAACQQVSTETPLTYPYTVGILAGGDATRTVIGENGLSSSWEIGDKMAVWARNSSDEYTLSSQVFGMYGTGDALGVFTATLQEPMAEDRYTYYASYPVPKSVQGTIASFTLPSEQDGRISGGADIMIADPVQHGPLTEIPKPDDHSGLKLRMNHILHHLRFYLPEGADIAGEPIRDMTVTMPRSIAGTVKADLSDPDAVPALSDGSNTIRLELENQISESAAAKKDYACVAIFPSHDEYVDGDMLQLSAYTRTYKLQFDPISLAGRILLPGHSTPVRLLPVSKEKYFRVIMSMGMNNIGETVRNISITRGGAQVYSYSNDEGKYSHIKIFEEFLGEGGESGYQAICDAVLSGEAKLVFETDHAIVEKSLSSADIVVDENNARLELGEVPYLLYENFDNALASEHNDSYSAGTSSDTTLGGYLLDDYLGRPGWNASRYSIFEGDNIRINCRYQSGAWVVGRYCGRLDTPAMSYLKDGASVSVKIEYDNAFYVPAGYNYDDSNNDMAFYILGTHTKSESTVLNGLSYNDIESNVTKVYSSPQRRSEDVMNMSHASHVVNGVTKDTRFAFFACTARNTSHIAANAVYYLYLDNIQASIVQ